MLILREKCGAGTPPTYESPAWLVHRLLRWLKQSLTRGEPNRPEAWLGQRAVGMETVQGSLYAEAIVLAAGAWASEWHASTPTPPIFPVKGQMMALQALTGLHLRHTVYASGVGGIVPKADGTIYVGATPRAGGI